MNAIEVTNLTKIYHLYDKPVDRLKEALNPFRRSYHEDFYAVKNVSFTVAKGEIVGIIGNNGAGKSTLLKMIAGVLTPTEGNVKVHGKVASLLELGAGFNPEMTGIENIYLNGTILGYTRAEIDAKLDEILAFADIGDYVHHPVKTYSSGMFARLAFSVMINVEPDILIVDEALSVGDSMFQHKCMARMRQMMQKGVTILFVSHSIDAVKALCDRAIWLEQGQIKLEGDATQIANIFLNEVFLEHNRIVESSLEEKSDDTLAASAVSKTPTDEESDETKAILDNPLLKIHRFEILDRHGRPTKLLHQKEPFTIRAVVECKGHIEHFSVGFLIKDRFGIELTGESIFNKFRKSVPCQKGQKIVVEFSSRMLLRGGESYAVALRVNSVSQWDRSDNIQLYSDETAAVFEVAYDPNNPMWFKFYQDFDVKVHNEA